jgi:signal transduction histidine kinase
MRLIRELRSHLHYKIILPFLLLTLLVALTGSAVAFLFIAGTAQERLDNQLAQVARDVGDRLVQQESENLLFLREVAFAQANPQAGAPAVANALADGDAEGLGRALEPYYQISAQRRGIRVDRLIAFDQSGRSLVDWERPAEGPASADRIRHAARGLDTLWFVPRILAGKTDAQGDKYAGLLDLGDGDTRYLFTVAPVARGDRIAGGLIVATRLDALLQQLNAQSQAAMVALYRAEDGSAFASSTKPASGLQALQIRRNLLPAIRDAASAQRQGIFDVVSVNRRNYQFAYAPLRVRGDVVGLISVALASDYVTGPWSDARLPLTGLTIALMLAIVGLGVFIARQITRPLQQLVSTAQAVTGGDLDRRSPVAADDEVGILSRSFNDMTAHLLDLYRVVRAEASQRAAIVDSITDGVIVCDPSGEVLIANRAMRALLALPDNATPRRFEHIPLKPLDQAALTFGDTRVADLYGLHDRVVRVACAPVQGDDGMRLGDVYVLQDLTSEVAVDRAKTNFIATISHELRTPLTVMGGTSELLLRNMAGTLTDEQRTLIESMRKHAQTMTSLLNNVITIANLESGTLTLDLEPVDLGHVLDSILWPLRTAMTAKGLELRINLPGDLPGVLADEQQLRMVLHQLLDNARRYTETGAVTLGAECDGRMVRVDISDTGRGISHDFCQQLFTRFARGAEGINSAERGIGLGLAIARELIERQGGKIWLADTSTRGSTFSFMLPCSHADPVSRDKELATAA